MRLDGPPDNQTALTADSSVVSLKERIYAREMMDDVSITDGRLIQALDNLRAVNVLLGGFATTMSVLAPYLRDRRRRPLRILDLGTGVADIPERLVRWAAARKIDVEVTALDVNAATVAHARRRLDERLPPPLRSRVHVTVGDALHSGFEDHAFDVAHAALFLHHFRDETAVAVLKEMHRVARDGLVVNDLHRHPVAYHSIRAIGLLLPVSPMFRNDGPLSVRRAFTRSELSTLASQAHLAEARIRWHWAFRWTLSTLPGA